MSCAAGERRRSRRGGEARSRFCLTEGGSGGARRGVNLTSRRLPDVTAQVAPATRRLLHGLHEHRHAGDGPLQVREALAQVLTLLALRGRLLGGKVGAPGKPVGQGQQLRLRAPDCLEQPEGAHGERQRRDDRADHDDAEDDQKYGAVHDCSGVYPLGPCQEQMDARLDAFGRSLRGRRRREGQRRCGGQRRQAVGASKSERRATLTTSPVWGASTMRPLAMYMTTWWMGAPKNTRSPGSSCDSDTAVPIWAWEAAKCGRLTP